MLKTKSYLKSVTDVLMDLEAPVLHELLRHFHILVSRKCFQKFLSAR